MSRVFMGIIVLMINLGAWAAPNASSDAKLKDKFAKSDFILLEKSIKSDRELKKTITEAATGIGGILSLIQISRNPHCDDDDDSSGNGESSCWEHCTDSGWSTTYCADKCGTDSGAGEKSCWEDCSDSGWSTSYCADKCGTDTGSGQKSCWDDCTDSGWSTSYCVDTCGPN
jgi:hypothetical protein